MSETNPVVEKNEEYYKLQAARVAIYVMFGCIAMIISSVAIGISIRIIRILGGV